MFNTGAYFYTSLYIHPLCSGNKHSNQLFSLLFDKPCLFLPYATPSTHTMCKRMLRLVKNESTHIQINCHVSVYLPLLLYGHVELSSSVECWLYQVLIGNHVHPALTGFSVARSIRPVSGERGWIPRAGREEPGSKCDAPMSPGSDVRTSGVTLVSRQNLYCRINCLP